MLARVCVCVIGHVYPVLFVGVISNDCQYPPASGRHEDYLSTGPMCRYAEDLLPMLRIMAGPNAHKYTTDRKPGTWQSRQSKHNKYTTTSVTHQQQPP